MAFGDLFKLAKLTIVGYRDANRRERSLHTFTAQYNPETLSIRHESVFQQRVGSPSGESAWSYGQPKHLTVNLVLDGTSAGYMGVERLGNLPTVARQISDFLATCYRTEGAVREPAYLRLHWGQALGGFAASGAGSGPSFDCQLKSVDINYKAFERDGSPLHAELVAVFIERPALAKRGSGGSSSLLDLTQRRVIVDGDTLPLLCREIYGSPVHYLGVALANGLDDFRNLTPGQELIFPPFDRVRKG